MATRKILITGATGKQGGAVLNALLHPPASSPPFELLALTRNADSAASKALAAKPSVSVVQGNLDQPEAIFEQTSPVWGVFSVQVPMGGGQSPETEEKQGKALVDAAVAHGVQCFVYTSVDRGGPGVSDKDPTNVPHFISKYHVETYLREQAAASPQQMGWTILRPVAFMDGFTPDFMGKTLAVMFKGLGDKKLQWVATKDIGHFAALAFTRPDEFRGQAISLAGDDLTFKEVDEIFKSEIGYPVPTTFGLVGSLVKTMIGDLGTMFKWFETNGYGANIPELRKRHPGLLDFRQWLKTSSKFTSK
ncbi:MAG: hypothetical protein M1838_003372 [Thelocarpon superellum]|nr:MAG: hypothetical protein M1838_003372 [Thelocarpon superellum]